MGPLISENHMNKVWGFIAAKKEGATVVCGGYRYTDNGCDKGYFVRPTILDNVSPDNTAVKNEIFGPVVTIQTLKQKKKPLKWLTIRNLALQELYLQKTVQEH